MKVTDSGFFEKYRRTLILAFVVLVQFYLFYPIRPWMPERHELNATTGMPTFKKYRAGRSSGVRFKVGDILLHCSFSALSSGLDGCDYFEDIVEMDKPSYVTWFWMHTRYGVKVRMLHSVEQGGAVIVFPTETYQRRMLSHKANFETSIVSTLIWLLILVVTFRIDRQDKQPIISRGT